MRFQSLLLVSVLALAACNNDPAKDKAKAAVADPAAVPAANASAVKYSFSAEGSKLGWVGAKVTGKHEGTFGKFDGTVALVDGDPSKSSVTVDVDVASITSDSDKLTGHLKSPDFFDVAKYPKAKFVSTSIKLGGDNGATHTVTGNLELHGVTKSITFPATIKANADSVDVDASFALRRKDFSIVYPGMPNDLIKDDVLLELKVRAKKVGA